MQVRTFGDTRANLAEVMERVVDDQEEVVITREGGGTVVMMSLDAWNAMHEALHLLSTPANARALRDAIAQLDAGRGTPRDLIDG